MKRWLSVLLSALAFAPAVAQADPVPPPAESAPSRTGRSSGTPPEVVSSKRTLPNYDGRDPPTATVGEIALWVPRILFSPLYFVGEYVLRWPLSVAIPAAERAELPRKIYDFFVFGKDHKAGILPVAFAEFGFIPSVGVYAFWNDAFAKDNDWSVHAEVWPTDWYAVSMAERMRIDYTRTVAVHASLVHRPDRVFYGIGPETLQSSQSRFTEGLFDVGALIDWRFWRASRLEVGGGMRVSSLGPGHYGSDPSVEQEAATGAFPIPYGFDRGYTAEYNKILLAIDTRQALPPDNGVSTPPTHPTHAPLPTPITGSGVRLEVHAEEANDVRRTPESAWIKYGASATAFVDLTGHHRVLSLTATTLFADPLGSQPIPFTELVALGGDGPMRGYYLRRLVDRSAAVATLQYVWPIGPWLGGDLQAAFGNVFGDHLEAFKPGLLRFSGAAGVSLLQGGDYPVEAIFGIGSETFDHGGQVDAFRFVVSVNHGF